MAALLLVLVAFPLASAAPFALHLQHASSATLAGATLVGTRSGVLDITQAVLDGAGLSGHLASSRGEVVTWQRVTVEPLVESTVGDPDRAPVALGASSLRSIHCGPNECLVALLADPAGGTISLSFEDGFALQQLPTPRQYCGYLCSGTSDPARTIDAGSFTQSTDAVPGSRVRAEGRFVLLLRDAWLLLRAEDGSDVMIDAVATTTGDSAGPQSGTIRYAALVVDGLSLACDECAVTLDADTLRLDFSGAMRSPDATGDAHLGDESRQFEHVAIEVRGRGEWEATPMGLTGLVAPQLGGSDSSGDARGDASTLTVGTETLRDRTPMPAAAVVATTLGGTAVLLAILPRLLLALYTRIKPQSVLENQNRACIHRLVASRPGITASEISRELGIARAVSQHHLRMLGAHSLIRARRVGIEMRYYEPSAAPTQAAVDQDRVLEDATRNRIALVIASEPGLTQSDLCVRAGVSQRLVSYHVSRLRRVGLVRADGRNPQRYHPDGALTTCVPERYAAA
ncbi:MAG: winged helix-turn-helix transcriptional regulator [Candidatus Thermoplasmatota archaeon]